jgi:hypothetical protein
MGAYAAYVGFIPPFFSPDTPSFPVKHSHRRTRLSLPLWFWSLLNHEGHRLSQCFNPSEWLYDPLLRPRAPPQRGAKTNEEG